jgi:DNA-binding transcriptional MerR regulator
MTPTERTYSIHEVAALTGLASARLRAWERRHAVVRPARQANGYRAYSGRQVALLRALAQHVAGGGRIGTLIEQPAAALIAAADSAAKDPSPVGMMLEAVRAQDRDRLESLVSRQIARLGLGEFAAEVAAPLAHALGDQWALGTLPVAAEHLASEVVVPALKRGLRLGAVTGPVVLAGCLPGERHEWGVLGGLARPHEHGWRVHYLGPDLPLEDAVEAAWQVRPRVLALSGSNPAVVKSALRGLATLHSRLPPGVTVTVGGKGAEAHARRLRTLGCRVGAEAFAA